MKRCIFLLLCLQALGFSSCEGLCLKTDYLVNITVEAQGNFDDYSQPDFVIKIYFNGEFYSKSEEYSGQSSALYQFELQQFDHCNDLLTIIIIDDDGLGTDDTVLHHEDITEGISNSPFTETYYVDDGELHITVESASM